MKKIILFLIIAILLSFSVNAVIGYDCSGCSEVYSDYWYWDDGDIKLNNGTGANNEYLVDNGGWIDGSNCASNSNCRYSNNITKTGSLSLYMNRNGADRIISLATGSKFIGYQGLIGFWIYFNQVTITSKQNIRYGTAFHDYQIGYLGTGVQLISSGKDSYQMSPIPVPLNEWRFVYLNISKTGIDFYFNNTLINSQTFDDGDTPDAVKFMAHVNDGAEIYIDGFRVTKNNSFGFPLAPSDEPPTYSNFSNNATINTFYNGKVNFSINLEDDVLLNGYQFASNTSGVMTNGTFNLLGVKTAKVSEILTVNQRAFNYICGQYSFNDSKGNQTQTELSCFNVYPNVNLLSPKENDLVRANPFTFNYSFDFNADMCYIYANLSGVYLPIANASKNGYNTTVQYQYTPNINSRYKFEENNGSVIIDSANTNNGTNTNNCAYQSSKGTNNTGNYSINFNGATQYIDSGALGSYERTQPFSISLWLKSSTTPVSYSVILGKYDSPNIRGYMAYIDNIPRIVLLLGNSASNYLHVTAPIGNVLDNNWHYLTFTYDGSSSAYGISIYIDGINQITTIVKNNLGGTILTSENFKIGKDNDGHYFTGNLDEVQLINSTINSSQVLNLYNYGYSNIGENVTIINGTFLMDSINSLDYTFQIDTVKSLSSFAYCYGNGIYKNSTFINYRYDNDFTAPSINLLFPSPNNQTFNTNININFTVSETAVCTINNTAFVLNASGTYWNFVETTLNNSFYWVLLNCSDISGNYAYKNISFTKDKSYPEIIAYSPLDNAIINSGTVAFPLNYTFLDNRDLYYKNITIWHYDFFLNKIIEFNDFSYISGTRYDYYRLIDFRNISNGTNYIEAEICDSHTANSLKNADSIKKDKNSLTYYFDGVIIKIKGNTGKEKKVDTKKLKDRYSFEIEYTEKTALKSFELSSNKKITPIPYERSNYIGHFVIDDKYWIDFDTLSKSKAKVYNGDNGTYIIEIDDENDLVSFNSIGSLNCVSDTNTFTKSGIERRYPFDLHFSLDNIGSVILLFSLLLFYIGLMIIAFTFMNLAFAGFGFFIGIAIGLILSSIHIFFFILFTLMNVVIFIQFARSKK